MTRPAGTAGQTIPDLLYSDVQSELRASVRGLLTDTSPVEWLLAKVGTEPVTDRKLWRSLAVDLGCAGLPVAESSRGAGASWSEVAVVAEELGRALAPVPFLGNSVLATAALLAAGETELLSAVAAGERTATLAVPFATMPGSPFPGSVRAVGDVLGGAVPGVPDAVIADELLVPAVDVAGPALYAVPAQALSLRIATSLDETRPLADVSVDGVVGRRVASGVVAEGAVRHALTVGVAILAAEQLGVADRVLEMTVAYLRERHQFGRPIGSFQALKHRVADVWVSVSQGRAVARYAAACAAEADADLAVAARLAKAYLSPVAVHACEEAVQLHGGIGFTWEHPVHLYLKRAKSAAIAFGTAARHRAALGDLVGLPAPVPAPSES
ncbi:MAG: acyl-CoA dehydrogenase family protein [Sciscionella sp.]